MRLVAPLLRMASPDVCLATSIALETASTCLLRNTISNKVWFVPVYAGYALSFYLFPKALGKYALGVAYTIWSGFGIMCTALYDVLLLRQIYQRRQLVGMLLVAVGIYLANAA